MYKGKEVIAILCADIHLSEKPPIARSVEPDWFISMGLQLDQLKHLANKHKCPIICAGDLFDRWNPFPRLINFAINKLPQMYSVPGQHDLPLHNYEDIKSSAYWTLVEAGKIENLVPDIPIEITGATPIRLHGFPWGSPIQPLKEPHDLFIEIAVVHDYIWTPGYSYPEAEKSQHVINTFKKGDGYNLIVSGDNHKPFTASQGDKTVFNCGGFYRRKADEVDHKPSIGLLRRDGSTSRHYLDCSQDKFIETAHESSIIDSINVEDFINELSGLADEGIDFSTAIKRALAKNKPDQAVVKQIYAAMENAK